MCGLWTSELEPLGLAKEEESMFVILALGCVVKSPIHYLKERGCDRVLLRGCRTSESHYYNLYFCFFTPQQESMESIIITTMLIEGFVTDSAQNV